MPVFTQNYLAEPIQKFVAITPSDSTLLGQYSVPAGAPIKALYVLTSGNLALRLSRDQGVTTIIPVTAGQVLSMSPKQVMATGTTAAVVAMF